MVRTAGTTLAVSALLVLPGVAAAADHNHNGMRDSWEQANHVSHSNGDPDHDGLRNRQEFRFGTDPRNADSDGDGTNDGQENAGVVASFTGGVLSVRLANGELLTAKVTPATQIDCGQRGDHGFDDQGDNGHAVARHGGGGDSQTGDNNGADNHGADDDNETADDHGGNDEGGATCTTADLVPGAIVHEADVSGTAAGATFKEVQLVK